MKPHLLDLPDCGPIRRPYNINREGMKLLFADVPESVKEYARELRNNRGWNFYAVDNNRGYCNLTDKVITIPMWVIRSHKPGEKIWYIAHELAHAYDKCEHSHGPEFMEWLKQICPAEYVHWELTYKPRNAFAAGIGLIL